MLWAGSLAGGILKSPIWHNSFWETLPLLPTFPHYGRIEASAIRIPMHKNKFFSKWFSTLITPLSTSYPHWHRVIPLWALESQIPNAFRISLRVLQIVHIGHIVIGFIWNCGFNFVSLRVGWAECESIMLVREIHYRFEEQIVCLAV